jgi:hypothetical protein
MKTIFLNNKYTKKYYAIIENARIRHWHGYTETHHIIPRCLGGGDESSNLVVLNGHEHLVCHLLLRKMLPNEKNRGVIAAAWRMVNMEDNNGNRHRVTGRVYAKLKEEFAKAHSAFMKGRIAPNKGKIEDRPDVLANIRAAAQKRNLTKKTCGHCNRIFNPSNYKQYHGDKCEKNPERDPNLITVKTRGKKRTNVQKQNHSKILTEFYKINPRSPMTQEQKDAISSGSKGVKKRKEQGEAISVTVAKQLEAGTHYSQQPKQQCPHCPVKANKARYNAFHGDKCKFKP